jgi:hypothetical protein
MILKRLQYFPETYGYGKIAGVKDAAAPYRSQIDAFCRQDSA